MILGFKDRFVPLVESGAKRHTIRAGHRWRVGMRADLYARVRQKDMRLIFQAPVVRVQEVQMAELSNHDRRIWIAIDRQCLNHEQAIRLAKADGFAHCTDPWQEFVGFFVNRLPFDGQLIHWDYEDRW